MLKTDCIWNHFNNQKRIRPLPSPLPLSPLFIFLSSLTLAMGLSFPILYFPKPKLVLLVGITYLLKGIIKVLSWPFFGLHPLSLKTNRQKQNQKEQLNAVFVPLFISSPPDESLFFLLGPYLTLQRFIFSLLISFYLCLLNNLFLCYFAWYCFLQGRSPTNIFLAFPVVYL